ncbi:MAG: hypothetical protein R3C56_39395 [Pirellulaceae bacterium]
MKNAAGDLEATIDLPSRNDLKETATYSRRPVGESRFARRGPVKKGTSGRVGLVIGSSPSMSEEYHERLRIRLRMSALLLGSGRVYLLFKIFHLYQATVVDHPLILGTRVAPPPQRWGRLAGLA